MIQDCTDNKGYVYILVNPAFPGFVKVGKTTKEPEIRARELSFGSGVPAPYAVAWDALVNDCHYVEKLIHKQLDHTRSRKDREFFVIPLKHAISIVSKIVVPFTCETDDPFASILPAATYIPAPKIMQAKRTSSYGDSKVQQERLVEIAEDCPVEQAVEPPNKEKKTIPRIEYETLIENPYAFTEREFFHEVNAVRRNKAGLKLESYLIQRSLLPRSYGWGIHINGQGKLALVAMESSRYKELQEAVSTVKSHRMSKV